MPCKALGRGCSKCCKKKRRHADADDRREMEDDYGSTASWEHIQGNDSPPSVRTPSPRHASAARPVRSAPDRTRSMRPSSAASSRTFQDRRRSMIVERHVYMKPPRPRPPMATSRPPVTPPRPTVEPAESTPASRPPRPPPGFEGVNLSSSMHLPLPVPSRSTILDSGATLTRRGAHAGGGGNRSGMLLPLDATRQQRLYMMLEPRI